MNRFSPIFVALVGILLGSLMDALVKDLSAHSAIVTIAAWRYIFGTALLIPVLWIKRPKFPNLKGHAIHAFRGVLQTAVALCLFWAITQLALAEATAIGFTATIMIAPMAHLLLGERASTANIVAALLGFVGVIVAVSAGADGAPMDGDRLLGALAAFTAAFCYALSNVLLRLRAGEDSPLAIAFYSNAVPAVLLVPLMLTTEAIIPLMDVPIYAMLGVFGVGLWLFLTIAYTRASAGQLAPLQYTSLIWSALAGCFFFDEVPTLPFFAGAGIVIAACWIAARHKSDTAPEPVSAASPNKV